MNAKGFESERGKEGREIIVDQDDSSGLREKRGEGVLQLEMG